MSALTTMSGIELAGLVARREVGAVELLDAYLREIDRSNGELTAIVQRFDGWARRHAKKIDSSPRRWPDPLPRFFGVPFAIKDNDAMKWTFTRVGSRAYNFALTPFDSLAVRRLRDAGFVMVGKTSTSEFALLPIVEPDIHPPTRNPFDPTRTAGGSSGGAGAAVAAGMLPIAHGADGGGSIRIPASFCGLYGYKASRGIMPHYYGPMESVGLSVAGTLARTVDDAAAGLDALCGDPVGAPGNFVEQSRSEPPGSLRIGFCVESNISEVHPEIAAAVKRVASILETLGHEVSELGAFEGDVEEFVPVYGRLAANVPVLREQWIQPVTRWLRSVGKKYSNEDARQINAGLSRRLDDWWGTIDMLVLPSVGVEPPEVNAFSHLSPAEHFKQSAALGAFTAPFNITGQPAASLPVGKTSNGLPIGVQIVARRGKDALVLQMSRALAECGAWATLARTGGAE